MNFLWKRGNWERPQRVDHYLYEVLHALLKYLTVTLAEPGELLLPFRQKGAELWVIHPESLILFTLLLVPVEPLVVDETHLRSRRLGKTAASRPIGLELENEGFMSDHVLYFTLVCIMTPDLRRGRHCFFALNVHLVFVTKYLRSIFTDEHLMTSRASAEGVRRFRGCRGNSTESAIMFTSW